MPALTARRPQTGFSLIELLIVLVIVGVLAGIAYPALPPTWTTSAAVAKHYQITLQPQGAQNYTLMARALPGREQVKDDQAGTSCSVLSLVVRGLETNYEPAACWQQ